MIAHNLCISKTPSDLKTQRLRSFVGSCLLPRSVGTEELSPIIGQKKSRRHSRRPEVAAEIRDLIRRMSQAEPVVRTTPHSRGTELHHRHLRRARLVGPRSKPVAPTFGFLEWKYRLSLIYRKR
jgi:hypothetical protein